MKEKIGILTYHNSDNFGSVLQAYALSRYLNSIGLSCEIIDYRKPEVDVLYRIFKPLNCRYNLLTNLYSIPYYRMLLKRKERFEHFRQTMLPLSKQRYTSAEQLAKSSYSSYLVGSDQVWNMDIVDFDLSYMLAFTHSDKVAYAASFGPKKKTEAQLNEVASHLRSFRRISVREKIALSMCKDSLGLPAELVCDPVFLLSESQWKEAAISSKKYSNPYILCYFPGGVPKELESFSQQLAKTKKCKRVLLMPEWRNISRFGLKCYNSGPGEFLDLILNADCVCTSSFHGAAFSRLLRKELYVFRNGSDDRIESLLEPGSSIGQRQISDHIFHVDAMASFGGMDEQIQASKDYLKRVFVMEH